MANWSDLKAAISKLIRENGAQQITGKTMQDVLLSIVSNLGKDCTYAGVATKATSPGTPDGNVFYLCGEGTYPNLGNNSIAKGEIGILSWKGEWKKEILKVGSTDIQVENTLSTGPGSEKKAIAQKIVSEKLHELDEQIKEKGSGSAPTIGEDGFWYIDGVATGVKAKGEDGKPGATPSIGDNGHWYINGVDTGVIAKGRDSVNLGDVQLANDLSTDPGSEQRAITQYAVSKAIEKGVGEANRPATPTSMGYKVLKNNLTFTEQVIEPNTIYEIRDKFDIGTFAMPKNCTLKFNGGCISNGTLTGDGTIIDATPNKIFENIQFGKSGSFLNDKAYAEWWGAESYTLDRQFGGGDADGKIEYFPITAGNDPSVRALKDSSCCFNEAIKFCAQFGSELSVLGACYAIEKTVYVLPETTIITSESTVFVVRMHGKGNVVITQNEDTAKFTTETLAKAPYYLKGNQLFATESMAVAFEVSCRRTKFLGRGSIAINTSTYTIGILVKDRNYETLDMSYMSPYLDMRIVGGEYACRTIDSRYVIGEGEPTDSSTNETGKIIRYYDSVNNLTYTKEKGSNTWKSGFRDSNLWNTSLRFDVGYTGNGARIINPYINVGDCRGYRGLEIYTHNGGWFNIGTWRGTLANKVGSFISIFTEYDVTGHDFDDLNIQVSNDMSYDARVFQAIKAAGIKVGYGADLVNNDIQYGYYFGKFTAGITLTYTYSLEYIYDLGVNNTYDTNINYDDDQSIFAHSWINLLKNKSPEKAGFVYRDNKAKLLKEFTSEEVITMLSKPYEGASWKDDPTLNLKYMFDEDKSTSETVISTDDSIYGIVMYLGAFDNSNMGVSSMTHPWLEISYVIESTNQNIKNYKNQYNIGVWNAGILDKNYIEKPFKAPYHIVTGVPSIYTNKLYIPIGIGKKPLKLAIFTKGPSAGTKLKIYSMSYYVNGYNISNGKNFDYWNSRNAIGKYQMYIDDKGINYNDGDAKNNQIITFPKRRIINHGVEDTSIEISANDFHIWGEVASLTLNLVGKVENGINEYMFEFKSGQTPTTLSFPYNPIKWIGKHAIEANKTYQVSIINNLAVMGGA